MKQLIETFYQAFQSLDAEAMVACYHPDVQFEDPAFGSLEGEHAKNMWRMLCHSQKGKGFRVEFSGVVVSGDQGAAHWEAWYTFGPTRRKVHNRIDASFVFESGKIIEHADHFDLYRWSRQAMGLQGALLGWTPLFKSKLQAQTHRMLSRFEAKK